MLPGFYFEHPFGYVSHDLYGKPHPLRSWDASRLPGGPSNALPILAHPGRQGTLAFRTPAGSVEDPVPPGTARHTVPAHYPVRAAIPGPTHPPGVHARARRPAFWAGVSCREGRCAVCLHCAAHRPGVLPGGTRGQVSWCPHRTPWHRPPHRPGVLPGGQVRGAAQVSRAAARCWAYFDKA
jgi:hypothetical protein